MSQEETEKPSWDSSQLTMATWLDNLKTYIFDVDDDFGTLVSHGFVLARTKVVVPTELHGIAFREELKG